MDHRIEPDADGVIQTPPALGHLPLLLDPVLMLQRQVEADIAPELLNAPPMPTITRPEDLPAGPFIPYASTDRTPEGPLQVVERMAADFLDLDPQLLISRRGEILEHGSVILCDQVAEPGDAEPCAYVIASWANGRLSVARHRRRDYAQAVYDRRREMAEHFGPLGGPAKAVPGADA